MQKGDIIAISFTGRDKVTGKVFDTTHAEVAQKEGVFAPTRKYAPIVVIAGYQEVLPGLEKEIESMKVGEERHVELEPDMAFGPRNPELVKVIPLSEFKKNNVPPTPGTVVNANDMVGKVQSVSGGRVRVDFNPDFAGHAVAYDIKVEKHYTDEKEQLDALREKAFPGQMVSVERKGKEVELTLPIRLMQTVQSRVPGFAKLVLDSVNGVEKVIVHTVFEKKDFQESHVHADGTMHDGAQH
ncbi:MAG: peptidylprolyl isomerase [Candidatus Diapherotrites archaeon]|nr:peptidylprolyl isomerase [Candidatus Diapherotrites archaeon]MDZ4256442.1 peptidylprolyl isomerase [archaeon]